MRTKSWSARRRSTDSNRAIGERVPAAGLHGNAPRTFTIVGRGVFPEFIHPAVPDSDTGAYNDFALLTESGAQPFAADAGGEYFGVVLVRWASGIDPATAASGLDDDGVTVTSTTLPSNLENLTYVESFPLIVAAFLVVLAAVALTHALVTSVQRRARFGSAEDTRLRRLADPRHARCTSEHGRVDRSGARHPEWPRHRSFGLGGGRAQSRCR